MSYIIFKKNPRNSQFTIHSVSNLSRNDYEDSKYIKCSKNSIEHLAIINTYFEEKNANTITEDDVVELIHIHTKIVDYHAQGLRKIFDHQVSLVMVPYTNMTYNYQYCEALLKLLGDK